MLPTNEKASIANNYGTLILANGSKDKMFDPSKYIKDNRDLKLQHLYFLSDEEIKEGDWTLYENEIIEQFQSGKDMCLSGRKKIISTTNKLAMEPYQGHYNGIDCTNYLSHPSQSFLAAFVQEYNKGNVIKEVMVEYEEEIALDGHTMLGNKLKINSNDNTIIIKKVKNSWNREEITKLLESCFWAGVNKGQYGLLNKLRNESNKIIEFKDWIEQNL